METKERVAEWRARGITSKPVARNLSKFGATILG
jgi:hypothetical protein